jgi:peptidoglycan/xylan/chitin deacetylase (PgdA/CDA1 family)
MFKRKKLVIFGITAVALACLVLFVRQKYTLPILMYHSVVPKVSQNSLLEVSVDTFESQMAFFKKHGYNIMALTEVKDYLHPKKKLPPRSVVLTFDDGYKDNYTYAFAILKKYKFPATVFLILTKVGTPGYLGWEEIREMQDSGLVTFGSHTFTHPFLDTLKSPQDLKYEVSGSRAALENKLGRPVKLFSYPLGRFDPVVVQAVKDAGYEEAVGASKTGRKYSSKDPFILKRLRISENSRNLLVFWFETTGYYTFVRETQQLGKTWKAKEKY